MKKTSIGLVLLPVLLAACAIEGVGFDGRVNAYRNAAADGREFAALNRGAHDAAWFVGWCGAIEPHFRRMSEQHARVERYCAAMQANPNDAEPIRSDLIAYLSSGNSYAIDHRDEVLRGLGISAQLQQAQAEQLQAQAMQAQALSASRPIVVQPNTAVHCTSTRFGNQVNTSCN
ncbi:MULTISPECIES: hypothetical protein [unclassified Caballeronia]|uniref:hypothetical protein n=1 Tax=unclassified Caballeronia TaxID=2646786 RepID=UPI0028653710|nr:MULTISPECIES: hypothetical protein [unclassified Caballeronia]MDR5755296.1 hypothetical protein [Caballeronia sp. LZ024]MDR5845415.1 hypothetical protein [Caballeronia sp. LZ031]